MADITPEMRTAFENLGVSPTDSWKTVRSAWRAMVRKYHPDHVRGDKAEANRRLAELNAAYDLVSIWTDEDRTAFARAAQKRREEQVAARRRREEEQRKAEAERAAEANRKRQSEQREREDAARKRASDLHKEKPLKSSVKPAARARTSAGESAQDKFLKALSQLAPRVEGRYSFSF